MWVAVSRGERVGVGWGDGVASLSLHGAHEGGLRLQGAGRFSQAGHRLVQEGLGHLLRLALVLDGEDELALGHTLQLRQILLLLILCGASVVGARAECACAEGSSARARASPRPHPPALPRPVRSHLAHRADREKGEKGEGGRCTLWQGTLLRQQLKKELRRRVCGASAGRPLWGVGGR